MSTQYADFLEVVKENKVVFYFLEYQHKAGSYSFSGQCAPPPGVRGRGCRTFSVGVFQWQRKATGDGLKPSKTIIRVRGFADSAHAVYGCAMDLCRRLQDGESFEFQSIAASRYLEAL